MKIALINTWLYGGASKSAQRLYKGFTNLQINHEFNFFVKNNKNKEYAIIENYLSLEKVSFFEKFIRKIKILESNNEINNYRKYRKREGLDYFSDIHNSSRNIQNEDLKSANVINLHWVAELLDYSSFFSKFKQPLYWTLHDQSPFLNGNHYEEKYSVDENGNVYSREKSDVDIFWENRLKKEKFRIFKSVKNLEIIAPSIWMSKSAKMSELFRDFKVHHIPNGLDTSIFKVLSKNLSKEVFGLPHDKQVILFVSENIEVNRKGLKVLLKALEFIKNENFAIAVVGKGNFEKPKELSQIPIFNLGIIIDERLMAVAYNAADLFVIPSLIDNLPNTAIEAVCCGTPVVGFATGGIPEIIQHGFNGYLTNEINAESLSQQIGLGLKNLSAFDSDTISLLAREKYNLQNQANAYLELFERHS